jgi:hypothetical protein
MYFLNLTRTHNPLRQFQIKSQKLFIYLETQQLSHI